MDGQGWDVFPLDDFNFLRALCNHEVCIRNKLDKGTSYLLEYLRDIDTTIMLVEDKYIDKFYLNDFTHYYATCFVDYSKYCKRIHFFKYFDDLEFITKFREYLSGEGENGEFINKAQANYNGFITVKRLPKQILGRTVLKTYDGTVTQTCVEDETGKRSIRCVRKYPVNLNGLPLNVVSLGFVEQDRVVAACATSALWSAFQKTAHHCNKNQPGLFEITNNATMYATTSRSIPSHGLDANQICQAIRKADFEPELRNIYSKDKQGRWLYRMPLLAATYGYLRSGIPAILTLDDRGEGHAITLLGYRLDPKGPGFNEMELWEGKAGIYSSKVNKYRGSKIAYYYAHDDQIGPFCKYRVITELDDGTPTLKIVRAVKDGEVGEPPMRPCSMIVPVYPIIRVPYPSVLTPAKVLCTIIRRLYNDRDMQLDLDIFLSSVNDYKIEIANVKQRPDVPPHVRKRILELSHPLFFWRIRIFKDGKEWCEMLTDATDMEESVQVYMLNIFDTDLADHFTDYKNLINPELLDEFFVAKRICELAVDM